MFAKIENGNLIYHNNNNPIINEDGTKTVTNNADFLLENGYYPVIRSSVPEYKEGFYYDHSWAIQNNVITDLWTEKEDNEFIE